MNRTDIWQEVEREMKTDKRVSPAVHDHIVSRASTVASAAMDLQKSSYEYKYRSKLRMHKDVAIAMMRQHAIKTIVKCVRFLENLDEPVVKSQNKQIQI